MSRDAVAAIAVKEFRDAWRNRWFLLDSAAFAVLALGVSYLGLAGGGMTGIAGFGRTSAALTSLVLLVVPLMGLSAGALSLTAERERGTLATLLAQPLTRLELFAGKWCGLASALAVALAAGFGLPACLIALSGGGDDAGAYLALAGLALLLALTGLAIGMLVSALAHHTAMAVGAVVALWLALVFVGDLGLLGAGLAMHLSAGQLLTIALMNPLTDFRVAAILTSGGSHDLLGPSGVLLSDRLGSWDIPVLVVVLAAWSTVPLVLGYRRLARSEIG